MGLRTDLMLFLPKWLLRFLLIFLAWQVVMFVWLRPREYAEPEKEALRKVCMQAVERTVDALHLHKQESFTLGVTHVIKDPSGMVTALLKTNLAAVAGFQIEEKSVIRKFLEDVTDSVLEATSLEEVVFAAGKVDLDVIVCGRIEEIHEEDGIGHAVLNYHLYDVDSSRWILKERIEADSREPQAAWIHRNWKRLLALLLIALIPWLSFPLSEKVAERNSNAASAALLAGFVAIDLLLLWWAGLFGATVAVPIVGIVLVLGYNLWACDFIAKKVE